MASQAEQRIAEAVRQMAGETASELGVEVVEVTFHRSGGFARLRIDLDRPGTPGVGIEDCRSFSESFAPRLDQSGLLEFHYDLEVSSPGLERPIATDDDLRRNTGRRVVVETSVPVEGAREHRGVLLSADAGALRILLDGGSEIRIGREAVARARQDIELEAPSERGRRRREHRNPRGIVRGDSGSPK